MWARCIFLSFGTRCWARVAFVSIDTLALDLPHLRVERHVGVGFPCRAGLPVRDGLALVLRGPPNLPSWLLSSWRCVLRCWAAHVVVWAALPRRRGVVYLGGGLPTLPFASLRCRGVACFDVVGLPYLGVRLPLSPWGCVHRRWVSLLRHSPLIVVVWLVLRRWVSLLRHSPLIVVVWLELRRWASPVVVGCPSAVFGPPRRCVVWDLGVVMGLAESRGWRC